MKKIKFCSLFLILFGAYFISCHKEGIYRPKQKIQQFSMEKVRFYAGDQIGEKEFYKEYWKWENKLLRSVRRESAAGTETMIMTYDGKKIRSIDIGNNKVSFSYKNGKIDKIESKGGGSYTKIIVDLRDKGDIVQLRYELSGNALENKNSFDQTISDLLAINRMIMPGHPSEIIHESFMEQKNAIMTSKTEIAIVLVTLQYNGNNIGKQTIENRSTNIKQVYNYTYDAKKSPFFYSFMELLEPTGTGVPLFCSQNNIISSYEERNSSVVTKYKYEYNEDDYPVKCEIKTTFDPDFPSDYSLETWIYVY